MIEAQTRDTLSHSVMCFESNEDDTKETLQTIKPKALTSLQVVNSCVFTCFRLVSLLNMLLCLLFCVFVSLIQSSSMFPLIHFSPVCEFFVTPCDYSHCDNVSFKVLSLHLLPPKHVWLGQG